MPRYAENLEGRTFGRLTVRAAAGVSRSGHAVWRCGCECGNVVDRLAKDLKRTIEPSCGCKHTTGQAHRNKYHGLAGTPVYGCWARMLQRCLNPKDDSYGNYGGRGVTVCERWLEFQNFFDDMGHPPSGTSIDRRDNDGPYSPDNCHWATKPEQIRNRRTSKWVTFNGRTLLRAEWATELGVPYSTLKYRLKHWSVERALTTRLTGER